MSARAYAGQNVAGRRPRQAGSRRRPAPASRRRPAARPRPARRRTASRVNWDRLGRVALTIVLAAVLFSYLNPLVTFVQTYREAQSAKSHLAELQIENTALERRVKSTRDPQVLEQEARRQGLVAPGERAYVVKGLN